MLQYINQDLFFPKYVAFILINPQHCIQDILISYSNNKNFAQTHSSFFCPFHLVDVVLISRQIIEKTECTSIVTLKQRGFDIKSISAATFLAELSKREYADYLYIVRANPQKTFFTHSPPFHLLI